MTIRLQDGTRLVEFDGKLLAQSSSDDGTNQRWTELSIYRSETGRYIVQKVGRSVVYHSKQSCSGSANSIAGLAIEAYETELMPCAKCKPPQQGDVDIDSEYFLEQDRFSVLVSANAQGLIENLRSKSSRGEEFLTTTATDAIKQASQVDRDVAEAYHVQRL